MPTYVYACSACDSSFEFDQRIVEDPITTCILCHAEGTIKRVIQPVGIAFKGSGFYVNDSVKAPEPSKVKKEDEPIPAAPEKTEKPAESTAPASTDAAASPAPSPAPATSSTPPST
jgi:putative FmdB family regulatory protein